MPETQDPVPAGFATITLDVVPGRGASFSLEIPEGVRFVIRSAVCARP